MNTDKYQSELKLKSWLSVIDKSRAINLRLSAFICGLIKYLKNNRFSLDNPFVKEILKGKILYTSEKEGAAIG